MRQHLDKLVAKANQEYTVLIDPDTPLHAEPVMGLRMIPPTPHPHPGDVLLGYAVIEPKRFKRGFSTTGWIITGVVGFIFWPLAWAPGCFKSLYEPLQMPVYAAPHNNPQRTTAPQQYPEAVKPPNPYAAPAQQ